MMNTSDYIVHICPQGDWLKAQDAGVYRAESLGTEGFIHCSRPAQALDVLNRFYQGVLDLLLLWIDPRQVEADIRWEAVDGDEFPHIYGPLNLDAVIAVDELSPDADGVYRHLPKRP